MAHEYEISGGRIRRSKQQTNHSASLNSMRGNLHDVSETEKDLYESKLAGRDMGTVAREALHGSPGTGSDINRG